MKSYFSYLNKLLLLISFLLSGLSSLAQQVDIEAGTTHEERAKQQALLISKELNLSESQKQQTYLLILDRSIKMMENREAKNEEGVRKAEKEYQSKFLSILNNDQMKKYKEIEDEKLRNPPH